MNSPSSSATTLQPMRRWRLSDSDLYCSAMKMRRSPELMQLLSVKSMIRYGPAEVDRRLGPLLGQRREPFAHAAGQHHHENVVEHLTLPSPQAARSKRGGGAASKPTAHTAAGPEPASHLRQRLKTTRAGAPSAPAMRSGRQYSSYCRAPRRTG